jgi:hypothetical protein
MDPMKQKLHKAWKVEEGEMKDAGNSIQIMKIFSFMVILWIGLSADEQRFVCRLI